jgi:hypothetical protein
LIEVHRDLFDHSTRLVSTLGGVGTGVFTVAESQSNRVEDAEVRAMVDKGALRDLAMRYARAIDRHDRELLLSCYHADAIDHHGVMFRGGPLAYADWQPQIMGQFELTAHYIMNTDYRVRGDLAEGELYFLAFHRLVPPSRNEMFVGGRYHDRYERRSGVWRIAHRSIAWDFAREFPFDSERFAFLQSLGDVGSGATDPSFRTLSLFGPGVAH